MDEARSSRGSSRCHDTAETEASFGQEINAMLGIIFHENLFFKDSIIIAKLFFL